MIHHVSCVHVVVVQEAKAALETTKIRRGVVRQRRGSHRHNVDQNSRSQTAMESVWPVS